ncbi:hypothetical protein F2P56_009944 [Juglans regia]|uniref:Uncharacterized protein n=1 Tax=Juglans regia TaxID=51240 RepID=A0A833Y0N3_JUGRE|nr:hypothetical protein F2P56_009944 [Juglans regia]
MRPLPRHLPTGQLPDSNDLPEIRRRSGHPRRSHAPRGHEYGGLPEGISEMVRGGGGERDRGGDHRRRSGGRAWVWVRGEVRQEEERDGELESDRGLYRGRVQAQAGRLHRLH